MRRTLALAGASMVLVTWLLQSPVHAHPCWNTTSEEADMARSINSARQAAGARAVTLDDELSKVARRHSRFMARRATLRHSDPNRLSRRVTRWNGLAENIGVGGGVDGLHRAFMGSPTHRQNVLWNDASHVGVGVVRSGGRSWVTVIFQSGPDPGTRFRMPRC